jgi:hypothetical protein
VPLIGNVVTNEGIADALGETLSRSITLRRDQ